MSKVSLERAIIGMIAGVIVAMIVSLFILLIAPLVGGILSVQLAGGNRKRSAIIGATTAVIWGAVYSLLTPLTGFGGVFSFSLLVGIILSVILGAAGGLIAHRFFKNNESKAEIPLPLNNIFKNKIVLIVVIVTVIVVLAFVTLYYIGSQKIASLFFKPSQISNIIGGQWTTVLAPQQYGYTENGKYYSSGVTAAFEYNNITINVNAANYSNLTSANIFYTNETLLMGAFEQNLTKAYTNNGSSQGFNYSFYNGTYVPLCLLNCKSANAKEGISEIIAVEKTYVISINVYNYSMTLNQGIQLAGAELSVLNNKSS